MTAPALSRVIAALDRRFPPGLAEPWDAVGLVCGSPDDEVRRVLFAVDPASQVVDEAIAAGVDLIVAHHPLFLGGVTSVATTTTGGAILHRLIRSGIALFTAHTNADSASPGVSDALARAIGLDDLAPLLPAGPSATDELDSIVVFVPSQAAEAVLAAMFSAGAGRVGDYEGCAWLVEGEGRFTPGPASHPVVGSRGVQERLSEQRIEVVAPRRLRSAVVDALTDAHPYEEPAYHVMEIVPGPATAGLGRVGTLAHEMSLGDLAEAVAGRLPATHHGVRVGGDPARRVRRVAVCGGSGDSLLGRVAQAAVDAYVTADLKHHRALDHLAAGGCGLIDVAHWASEWPWLQEAGRSLGEDLRAQGTTVEISVSDIVTDPWSGHVGGHGAGSHQAGSHQAGSHQAGTHKAGSHRPSEGGHMTAGER